MIELLLETRDGRVDDHRPAAISSTEPARARRGDGLDEAEPVGIGRDHVHVHAP